MIHKDISEYTNTELSKRIDETVRGERARLMLKRRLIDKILFEPLAEEFGLSTRQAQNIIYRAQEQLFRHL